MPAALARARETLRTARDPAAVALSLFDEVAALTETDPVTGLANRAALDRRVDELLTAQPAEGAAAGTGPVSLLLLDLDRFEEVNDGLGHEAGDRLLVEVARRIGEVLPDAAVTARTGGDEFAVVPRPGLSRLRVRRLAQALVDRLREPYRLPGSGEELVLSVSIGITVGPSGGSAAELVEEADLALHRAKDAGRDRYVVFDDALRRRARDRRTAESLLRSALDDDRIELTYQPIVDLRDGLVAGAEALVRVRGPDALLGPEAFIDVAEDTGMVVELDCRVIEAAVRQAARWAAQTPPGRRPPWLAVNVSPRSMEHPRVVRRLLDAVRRRGLDPRQVRVELTERTFLGTLPGAASALRQLIDASVPVGIDDFGTGYSALAYLPRFELDFLKIDRSFVAEVGRRPRADAVVTAIVDLAHAHGMRVTAEGVETGLQARRLVEIGCDLAQGYHFGRAGPPNEILGM